jgi:hypothetical protein
MLRFLTGLITGPASAMMTAYIASRERSQSAALEREVKRDFMHNELQKAMLNDDYKRNELASNIIRRDRGDSRTSWIRPVTAAMALVFWMVLTLTQMRWVGYAASNQLLPITWDVPPGTLGTLFTAFPLGVLTTFYISRPIEKFFMGRT